MQQPLKKTVNESMAPEDSNFIPEIELDPNTGEMVDVNTRKKYVKPFRQSEYKPLSEYGG